MHTAQRNKPVTLIKNFNILQWTEDEYLKFIQTPSDQNYSDSLSKQTARTKFYKHTDIFIGRRKPSYILFVPGTTPLHYYSHNPTGNSINSTGTSINKLIRYMAFSTSNNMNKLHTIINNLLYNLEK